MIKTAGTQNTVDKRILIAEDDPNASLILQKTLQYAGYNNIHIVNSGKAAINYLQEHDADIFISDIAMPGDLDGIEAAKHVDQHYHLPIIFITGFSDNPTIQRAKDVKPAAYLLKPYRTDDVIIAIEIALHKAHLQEELRKTEQHNHLLATALQNTQDAIIITNTEPQKLNTKYVNQSFSKLYGYEQTEVLGKDVYPLIQEEDTNERDAHIAALLHSGEPQAWEQTLTKKDGSTFLGNITASPIRHEPDKGIEHLLFIIRDITEARTREQRQQHSQKIEAIGRFTGGIAHDFNNILAVINAYSDLLEMKMGQDHPHIKYIKNIRTAGQRGTDLVAQLMTFTRSQPTPPTLLDLPKTVESTYMMLRRIIREDIDLSFTSDEDIPPIKASPSQIEQILVNLCVNARDAILGTGSIGIHINTHTDHKGKSFVCMDVRDDGIGMDADTQEKIFEPFFTTKDVGQGTGLGLSTVYGIVKQYQGYIEVKSTANKGSTFHVCFPAALDTPLDHPTEATKTTSQSKFTGHEHVLVVEDDSNIADSISGILSMHGYTVDLAHDGNDALDQYLSKASEFDLLISDLVLPTQSGQKIAEAMLQKNPKCKVIFITGYDDSEPPKLSNGASTLLKKPFKMKTLLETCQNLINS